MKKDCLIETENSAGVSIHSEWRTASSIFNVGFDPNMPGSPASAARAAFAKRKGMSHAPVERSATFTSRATVSI